MGRLTTLKPAMKVLRSQLSTVTPGSWRSGKQGSTARGYGYRWQKARERFLEANPLCCYCTRDEQRVQTATVVDHRTPHQGDERLFWDESNWQPLCKVCHDRKKAREESEARGGV